ncbi:MAG: phosphoribosylformylglycinamidine synthase subunit PurQ [Lentisphaerae bacterium]|nr:phosphoribosylformylglycinamidine synthase subunit PurQ [Lentisphaerota bacterium]
MASKPKVLIITGYGLSCEAESQAAWEMAGAQVQAMHLHDLLAAPAQLLQYQALMLIGGASFGDQLGAGQVLAGRLRGRLQSELHAFIAQGHLLLGIDNGFLVMLKLGLLPGLDGQYSKPRLSALLNDSATFQTRWVRVGFENTPCVFTRGLPPMDLPIGHAEGKLFTPDKKLLERLETEGAVACRYLDPLTDEPANSFPHNPRVSLNVIAGLCDPSGPICVLLPDPEAYLFPESHPQWTRQKISGNLPTEGWGLQIFRKAVAHLRAL